jgi:transcriptional regulator with XRE-family HTH domain
MSSESGTGGSLGEYLKSLREARATSLRDVEEKTGVSNAYLSQIETGSVSRPSPHILYKLAEFYRVDHIALMERAGHIKSGRAEASTRRSGRLPTSTLGDLTAEEEEALLRYLRFYREERRRSEK